MYQCAFAVIHICKFNLIIIELNFNGENWKCQEFVKKLNPLEGSERGGLNRL